jgi:hypothetical protein
MAVGGLCIAFVFQSQPMDGGACTEQLPSTNDRMNDRTNYNTNDSSADRTPRAWRAKRRQPQARGGFLCRLAGGRCECLTTDGLRCRAGVQDVKLWLHCSQARKQVPSHGGGGVEYLGVRDFADTSALYRLIFCFLAVLSPTLGFAARHAEHPLDAGVNVRPGDRQISHLVRPKPHRLLSMATSYTEAIGSKFLLHTSCWMQGRQLPYPTWNWLKWRLPPEFPKPTDTLKKGGEFHGFWFSSAVRLTTQGPGDDEPQIMNLSQEHLTCSPF